MKKSKIIELVFIGSSFISLSACQQERATQFLSKEECEKTHGEGKCAASERRHSMGSYFFVPMMLGRQAPLMMGGPHSPANTVQRGGFGATGNSYGFSSGG